MLYLPSTISITNLALPAEEPTIDDDVDGAVKGGTTSDDVECGVDDGDGSKVCGGGTMGGGLISDKGAQLIIIVSTSIYPIITTSKTPISRTEPKSKHKKP